MTNAPSKPHPAVCGECLHSFDEPATRIPCPRCGSTARAHIRNVNENLSARDKAK